MTVGQLMQELKKLPTQMEVCIAVGSYCDGSFVPLSATVEGVCEIVLVPDTHYEGNEPVLAFSEATIYRAGPEVDDPPIKRFPALIIGRGDV